MEENLTQEELAERVAILRRFRSLLEQQRTKFREYLRVLEMQESRISEEDADSLLAHTELETQIVDGISSLQKVIVPMQALYIKSGASTYNPAESMPITKIQEDLTKLQNQVLEQNKKNRKLIKIHLVELRDQILNMKNPYKGRSSVYAENYASGNMFSIDA